MISKIWLNSTAKKSRQAERNVMARHPVLNLMTHADPVTPNRESD